MTAEICPCETDAEDPGPGHLASCPWNDPEYDGGFAEENARAAAAWACDTCGWRDPLADVTHHRPGYLWAVRCLFSVGDLYRARICAWCLARRRGHDAQFDALWGPR